MVDNIINITDIYNHFAFEWLFPTDSMKWQAPAHLLLGETSLYESGDHFANRLTPANFDKRIAIIYKAALERVPYSIEYELQVQKDKVAKIQEQGRVFFTPQGQMLLCRGYVRSTEVRPELRNEYFSTSDLVQYLDQLLEKKDKKDIHASFVYLSLDRLPLIGVKFGVKAMHRIMDEVHSILDASTRDYDTVGRISGTSFGIILQKCSHSEIVVWAKRMTEILEEKDFGIDGEELNIKASIGGCVIQPSDVATTENILNHSERALLDAQHIKKIAIPTAHVAHHLAGTQKKKSKKRRHEDVVVST